MYFAPAISAARAACFASKLTGVCVAGVCQRVRAVHAAGKLSLLTEPAEAAEVLRRTVETYESSQPTPWQNQLPAEMNEKLVASIVAFRMPIERIEGKFKLGQNRAAVDQIGAIEALESAGDADSVALAKFARKQLGH